MYAIKEAEIAKEHAGGDLDCSIFFMDMRTHGKEFEKYYKDYIKQPFIVIPGHFQKDYKGVLGIIAGRLAETHHKPAIVMNYNKEIDKNVII